MEAAPTPPSQVYVIVDAVTSQAAVQAGQPPTSMGAWLLEIPAGDTAEGVAERFIVEQNFPLGSVVHLLDAAGATVYTVSVDLVPGG